MTEEEFEAYIEDYQEELCTQADALGMESLTEDQQSIVEGTFTYEYWKKHGI